MARKIFSMRNVISTMDIATMPKDETVSAINKSMLEQTVRYSSGKQQSEKWMLKIVIMS